jgi:iron complex outermembrane recepter protein
MVRFTPRWTYSGNFTKQKVMYRAANVNPANPTASLLADKWVPPNPAYMYNMSLTYDNQDWGFSTSLAYNYVGRRYFLSDNQNAGKDQEEVKTLDLAVRQTFFDGLATLYGGVKNLNDRMYALNTAYSIASGQPAYTYYPEQGRTYYGGIKCSMDFDKMKIPSTADLQRMQTRLYGALGDGWTGITETPRRIRDLLPF